MAEDDDDEHRGSQPTSRGGWGDHSEKLVAPADFDGPTVDRHCTDVLCAGLLLASWIVMTGLGIYAMVNGNIDFLIRPLDFDGGICGTNYNNLDRQEYPYLLYVNEFAGGVCVKECPNLMGVTEDGLTDVRTLVTYGGLWQIAGSEIDLSAGTPAIQVADYSNSSDAIFCSEEACFPNNSTEASWTSAGISKGYGFAFYAATTYELLYRCLLTSDAEEQLMVLTGVNTTDTGSGVGIVNDVYNFWNKLFSDLYLARNYIFGFGCGVSLMVSLIYIFLMRLPALLTTVIWTSILVTILMFVLGGYYAWSQATAWSDANPQTVDDQTINVTTGFSFALYGIAVVLVLLACCLRQAIMDAIVCTREAGRAVNTMTIILLVPVLQAIGFFLFMLPFVYYSANLASLATITTKDVPVGVEIPGLTGQQPEIAYRVFEFDDFTENCGWYFLFCFFWTGNFVVAMGDVSSFPCLLLFAKTSCALKFSLFKNLADYCISRIKVVLYKG
jgi:Plasma-membrane choline transporter